MQKKEPMPLKLTAVLAMLAAISIICGKYLAIRGGDILRFSFENLPIIFAGIAFGPVAGMLVGALADLIGCVLVGYAINPIVTLGAAAIGLCAGLLRFALRGKKIPHALKISITVAVSHLVGSVIIKTFGLSAFYDIPLYMLMMWRLLNYIIVGVIEGIILYVLFKNKMLASALTSLRLNRNKIEREGKLPEDN